MRVAASLLGATLLVTTFATPATMRAQATRAQRVGDTPTGDLPPAQQAAADSLAELTIQGVCMTCHPLANIVRVRRTPVDWNAVVTRMAANGARGTDEQFRTIRRYFTRYYGTIRVNRAPAEEFSAVLGYSPKAAAAIVAYRRSHGPFADVEALAKVPGIDRTKLDELPQALRFDRTRTTGSRW